MPGRKHRAQERRCIATGETLARADLVRFVVGPDGEVTPDLAERLPGRGIWVKAARSAVAKAAAKGLFARAAQDRCTAPPDLADRVGMLLRRRALDSLGFARKAGELVLGAEKLVAAAAKHGLAALIFACDGSPDSRRKLTGRVAALGLEPGTSALPLFGALGSEELSLAMGRPNVVHAALKKGRMTDKVLADLGRAENYERA